MVTRLLLAGAMMGWGLLPWGAGLWAYVMGHEVITATWLHVSALTPTCSPTTSNKEFQDFKGIIILQIKVPWLALKLQSTRNLNESAGAWKNHGAWSLRTWLRV